MGGGGKGRRASLQIPSKKGNGVKKLFVRKCKLRGMEIQLRATGRAQHCHGTSDIHRTEKLAEMVLADEKQMPESA